ncbi:MAG: hypothetical protein JXB46_11320 [Candidatus Eisenbacteria bacterium]|nr:hypothetical protein [Candidatus Eisenbacteria bacterium]
MTYSSNISTLITIVFGLMLTELFVSVHRLIRNRRRVRWHWLPLLVSWYVLVTVLKNWWGFVFGGDDGAWGSGWVFFFYGHILLLLYLVVSAVLPDEVPAEGLDLKEHYFETRRHFWGLLAGVNLALLIFALLRPVLFSGSSLNLMAVLSNIAMGAVALSLAWIRRFGYHAIVVVMLVVLTVVEVAVKF